MPPREGFASEIRFPSALADRYQLLDVVGVGGSSTVFRAHQVAVERDVAVKVVRAQAADDRRAQQRFQNEARIIGRLRHPNTIRLYDFGRTEEGDLFIVTELLRGESLSEVLKKGPLELSRALDLAEQIAGSLAEAHAQGIIHRDLKPDNIFLEPVGDEDMVKVFDFGIARDAKGEMSTHPGHLLGSPQYMAPEQAGGEKPDHRADIYSFGALLYHLIAGVPPFIGETTLETLAQHCTTPPKPLLSREARERAQTTMLEMERLVLQMLSKSPDERPPSMLAVRARVRELARMLDSKLPAPTLEELAPVPQLWAELDHSLKRSRLARIGVLMLAVAAIVATTVTFLVR